MIDYDKPLTQIEQSRADTGFRFYLCHPSVYDMIAAALDSSRGYPLKPSKAWVERSIPLQSKVPISTDGRLMVAVRGNSATQRDEEMLSNPALVGKLEEVTKADWDVLKPTKKLP